MAYIKPSKPFNQELEKVLAYAMFEFGVTTVKRFNQAYQSDSKSLGYSSLLITKRTSSEKFFTPIP